MLKKILNMKTTSFPNDSYLIYQLRQKQEQLRISFLTNSCRFTLLDKLHFYSKQKQMSLLYLISLQCFCRVGRRNGCVELCLWLTQKCNSIPVSLIALLHLPICLHSFVQNVMVIGSLQGQEEKERVYIISKLASSNLAPEQFLCFSASHHSFFKACTICKIFV